MNLYIYLKGKKEPLLFTADRIDVLDINLQGIDYKQIRYFRNGFSKSEYIESKLIVKLKEK